MVFNLSPVISGVTFDTSPGTNLNHISNNSVTVLTPEHLPAGVIPQAGGEGILLALAMGMGGMGRVLASRRHRRETHSLSHASHE